MRNILNNRFFYAFVFLSVCCQIKAELLPFKAAPGALYELYKQPSTAYEQFMKEFLKLSNIGKKRGIKSILLGDKIEEALHNFEQRFDEPSPEHRLLLESLEATAKSNKIPFSKYTPRIVHNFLKNVRYNPLVEKWLQVATADNPTIGFIDLAPETQNALMLPVSRHSFLHDFCLYFRHYYQDVDFQILKDHIVEQEFFKLIFVPEVGTLSDSFWNHLGVDSKIALPLEDGFNFEKKNCRNEEEWKNFVLDTLKIWRVPGFPPDLFGYFSWPKDILDVFHKAVKVACGKTTSGLNPVDIHFAIQNDLVLTFAELRLIYLQDYFGGKYSKAQIFERVLKRFRPTENHFSEFISLAEKLPTILEVTYDGTRLVHKVFLLFLEDKNPKIRENFIAQINEHAGVHAEFYRELLSSIEKERSEQMDRESILRATMLGNKEKNGSYHSLLKSFEEPKSVSNKNKETTKTTKKKTNKGKKSKKSTTKTVHKKPANIRDVEPNQIATSALKKEKSTAQGASIPSPKKPTSKSSHKNRNKTSTAAITPNIGEDVTSIYPNLTPQPNEVFFTATAVTLSDSIEDDNKVVESEEPDLNSQIMIVDQSNKVPSQNPFSTSLDKLRELDSIVRNPSSVLFKSMSTWVEYLAQLEHLNEQRRNIDNGILNIRRKMIADSSAIFDEYQRNHSQFLLMFLKCQAWLQEQSIFDETKQQIVINAYQDVSSLPNLLMLQHFQWEMTESQQRYEWIKERLEQGHAIDLALFYRVSLDEQFFNPGLGTGVPNEISAFIADIRAFNDRIKIQLERLRQEFPDIL